MVEILPISILIIRQGASGRTSSASKIHSIINIFFHFDIRNQIIRTLHPRVYRTCTIFTIIVITPKSAAFAHLASFIPLVFSCCCCASSAWAILTENKALFQRLPRDTRQPSCLTHMPDLRLVRMELYRKQSAFTESSRMPCRCTSFSLYF